MLIKLIKESFKPKPTEVEVNYTGQKVWLSLASKQLTPQDILWIQKEHGYNVACWVLYKFFKEHPRNHQFLEFIEQNKNNYSQAHRDYTVVVLAHNPWVPLSQNEEYQWRLKNIAADMGFQVFTPEISYRRSLFANAYAHQESLKRFSQDRGVDNKIIFLSQGVASLELKWMLQKTQNLKLNVLGWVNVAGLLHGTSLPPTQSRWAKAMLDFVGGYPVHPDVSRENSYCHKPPQIECPMISMLPFSPDSRFQWRDRFNNEDLRFFGPHDGYSSLVDYMSLQSIVWPIWGESHFMDVEVYKNRMQAAFKFILQQQPELQSFPVVRDELTLESQIDLILEPNSSFLK